MLGTCTITCDVVVVGLGCWQVVGGVRTDLGADDVLVVFDVGQRVVVILLHGAQGLLANPPHALQGAI